MTAAPFRLDGRVALVTGASRGIGRAVATALADAGADVAVLSRTAPDDTAAAIEAAGRRSIPISCDLAEATPADLDAVVAQVTETLGAVDILVNNAGTIRRAPATEYPPDDWTTVLHTNLDAAFYLSQAAGARMIHRRRGGRIINVASMLSYQGGVFVPAYTASKHGIVGITKALANEWAASGVTVNAVAPGYIATDNTAALRRDPKRNREILERIPTGRWGTPQDVTGAFVYLASDEASYVTGAVIPVDGGWLAR